MCVCERDCSGKRSSLVCREGAYLFDVVLQNLGDGQTVVGILSRDVGERGNLDARVHRQILQGLTVVVSHFGGIICHGCGRQTWNLRSEARGQAQRCQGWGHADDPPQVDEQIEYL